MNNDAIGLRTVRPRDTPPRAPPDSFEPTDERTRAEITALLDEELLVVNLDISVIAVQSEQAQPELREVEALRLGCA